MLSTEDTSNIYTIYKSQTIFKNYVYNNNNNVIYIAPFIMCSRRLEESRKKMRFQFVFEPVHMIDSTDTAR